jgi:hypothetical protein
VHDLRKIALTRHIVAFGKSRHQSDRRKLVAPDPKRSFRASDLCSAVRSSGNPEPQRVCLSLDRYN